jgi:hypothetical protein
MMDASQAKMPAEIKLDRKADREEMLPKMDTMQEKLTSIEKKRNKK